MSPEQLNYEIVKKQEERLKFDHFDNEDAWKLGCVIVNNAREAQVSISVEIWINGYQVFRYGFPGTNNFNDIWMQRKVNTVNMFHRSSLRVHYMPCVGEDDIYVDGLLDPTEFGNMGGGFPIYVKGTGVIGAVAVSGLTHTQDHQLAVDGIAKYLGVSYVEKVKGD